MKTSGCSIRPGDDAERQIVENPIKCEHCAATISGAVALSFEGADYLYHFCGVGFLQVWCEANMGRSERRRVETARGTSL